MDVPDSTLTDLIARVAKGDSVALRALYEHTARRLFAVLLRIIQRRDLAEEALQEVFVSIWRNAHSFKAERGRPMTWLISMARYRAIDVRRSRRHEYLNRELADVQDTLVAETADVLEQVTLLTDASRLADCMGHLSKQQDTCIRLAFLEGLSHDEIARKLTSPIGTVKTWIRRGLQALKDCLVA